MWGGGQILDKQVGRGIDSQTNGMCADSGGKGEHKKSRNSDVDNVCTLKSKEI